MDNIENILYKFINQALEGDLKTSVYPKEWLGLGMKVSFGMGAPARVPWVGFTGEGMTVSRGINPVYLYYKDLGVLILAYGVSETQESPETWPAEVINSTQTVESYFDKKVPRYGDSFVFRAYEVRNEKDHVLLFDKEGKKLTGIDIESDLSTIVDYYKKVLSLPEAATIQFTHTQGLFYMEKQLEDFIVHNWESTELGSKYDLIIEEGILLSQQYRTDIGPIDILVKDKKTSGYVVIELKKNQTSDDTVGQIARYMGWVKQTLGCSDVKGVIIAGSYDQKLAFALSAVPNVEVFLYEVNFELKKFSK